MHTSSPIKLAARTLLILCSTCYTLVAEEVFRREIPQTKYDLVLNLTQDEIIQQQSYNLWEQALPLDAIQAAEIAVNQSKPGHNKRQQFPYDLIQIESVELIRYDKHDERDFNGKYFYFVKVRLYQKDIKSLSSQSRYWAVFPNGLIKMLRDEEK